MPAWASDSTVPAMRLRRLVLLSPAIGLAATLVCEWYFVQAMTRLDGLVLHLWNAPLAIVQFALCAYGQSLAREAGSRRARVFYRWALLLPCAMLLGPCLLGGPA